MGIYRWILHQTRREIGDRIDCSKNPDIFPDDPRIYLIIACIFLSGFYPGNLFIKLGGPPQIRTSDVCLSPSSKLSKQGVVKRVSKEKKRTGQ